LGVVISLFSFRRDNEREQRQKPDPDFRRDDEQRQKEKISGSAGAS
jgi:hypothetical protein